VVANRIQEKKNLTAAWVNTVSSRTISGGKGLPYTFPNISILYSVFKVSGFCPWGLAASPI